MTTTVLSDTDIQLRNAVTRQLDWDLTLDVSAIGVTANGGAVTLTGYADSYSAKLAAERAAKRVRGVRAVANDIEVRLRLIRVDADIARDIAGALQMRVTIPDAVQAAVRDGHVTLTGQVATLPQKREADRAVREIRGVREVLNLITIAPADVPTDVRDRILETLRLNAAIHPRYVTVTLDRDRAVLAGRVRSWLARDIAERAAAGAPGIVHVDNRLIVDPHLDDVDAGR